MVTMVSSPVSNETFSNPFRILGGSAAAEGNYKKSENVWIHDNIIVKNINDPFYYNYPFMN